MPRVIRLVTRDTAQDMLDAAGSAAWYGNRSSFEGADYFLAVEKGSRNPVLLAKIAKVVPVPESGPKRFSLQFKRYVLADGLQYEPDNSSNPAISRELSDILPDVELESLDWKTAPKPKKKWSFTGHPDRPPQQMQSGPRPRSLTIAEAKRGLSAGLGVDEDQIEILIRG